MHCWILLEFSPKQWRNFNEKSVLLPASVLLHMVGYHTPDVKTTVIEGIKLSREPLQGHLCILWRPRGQLLESLWKEDATTISFTNEKPKDGLWILI